MKISKIVVNGNEYEFVCTFCSKRDGFRHICTLLKNNQQLTTSGMSYLNRTWESYTYQSVMLQTVHISLSNLMNYYVENYKKDNNIKRLTKEKREIIEKKIKENNDYMELKKVYMQL